MTAATAASSAEVHAPPAWPLLRVGGSIMALGALAVVLTWDDVLVHPGWFSAFSLYNVLAFASVGLLWLRLRPASRVGVLLLATAAVTGLQAMQGSSSSFALSLGVLLDPVLIVVWIYLLLTFPAIRLDRWSAAVLAVLVATLAVAFVPWFFFSEHVAGATPLARCTPACPGNAFLIADRPNLATHFGDVESLGRTAFAVLCFALLCWRLVAASVPRRRVLVPVYAIAAVWVVAFGAYGVASELIVTDQQVWDTIGWSLTGTRIALPLAFAISIVAARSFAGLSLARMISDLAGSPTTAALERVTARALGDPALRLAFRAGGSSTWVGAGGREVQPPEPGSGRSWREIRTGVGDSRAALDYDEILDQDPELLDAAESAVQLSVRTQRLEHQLQESTGLALPELSDAERQRIEQDLHDGAQQRLVVIGMDLERLRQDLPSDMTEAASELMRLGDEVDRTLEEIRDVAHGAFPSLLTDLGLRAALAEAVRSHPRAKLDVDALPRYPQSVESAVYFAAVEAIQNATKHAGPGAAITASLWETPGELWFEVRDDGRGFEAGAVSPGGGISGLSRRLAAVDGNLQVFSAPGNGTVVSGCVPLG